MRFLAAMMIDGVSPPVAAYSALSAAQCRPFIILYMQNLGTPQYIAIGQRRQSIKTEYAVKKFSAGRLADRQLKDVAFLCGNITRNAPLQPTPIGG
jgi:hypothetical protein